MLEGGICWGAEAADWIVIRKLAPDLPGVRRLAHPRRHRGFLLHQCPLYLPMPSLLPRADRLTLHCWALFRNVGFSDTPPIVLQPCVG